MPCAKQVTSLTGEAPRQVFFAGANAQICKTLHDAPPSQCQTKEADIENFSWSADWQAFLLALQRLGGTILPKVYINQLYRRPHLLQLRKGVAKTGFGGAPALKQ